MMPSRIVTAAHLFSTPHSPPEKSVRLLIVLQLTDLSVASSDIDERPKEKSDP